MAVRDIFDYQTNKHDQSQVQKAIPGITGRGICRF